jgi:hypothetical protein
MRPFWGFGTWLFLESFPLKKESLVKSITYKAFVVHQTRSFSNHFVAGLRMVADLSAW